MSERLELHGLVDARLERRIRLSARRQARRTKQFRKVVRSGILFLALVSFFAAILKEWLTPNISAIPSGLIHGGCCGLAWFPFSKKHAALEAEETRRILARLKRCTSCGYSLRRLAADRCPECGAPTPPRRTATAPAVEH